MYHTIENRDGDKKSKKYIKMDYAKAYVLSQPFENVYDPETSLKRGTIFKDLDKPYSKQLL